VQAPCDLPKAGNYFSPSLFLDVDTTSTVMQQEIFGPVISAMTFRTADEALSLANHTRYGLAASIWSENINVALDAAAKVKAGVVWINSTNQFDAAAGFGGYKESGFGREGGREGLYEYMKPTVAKPAATVVHSKVLSAAPATHADATGSIDRTAKLYIGGKQARPDSGYSYAVQNSKGKVIGHAGLAHNRAQVLYYIAENLSARSAEFIAHLVQTGTTAAAAKREVSLALERTFFYAAHADKYDGRIHSTNAKRQTTLAFNEPFGVMGLVCSDQSPLLGMVSMVMPVLAMGNCVVVVPSQSHPLLATDFYQILDTSDVPAGAVNIVTGNRDELAKTLAEHDEVAALWYHGSASGSAMVENASAGNLKSTWVNHGLQTNWSSAEGTEFLRRATQVKNIWIPYGE
jgi:aldehyde dehydrogenase (NAD+)